MTGGGSDGNFTAALGVPTLDGLGAVGEGAHAAHESILVDRIADRTALLAKLVARSRVIVGNHALAILDRGVAGCGPARRTAALGVRNPSADARRGSTLVVGFLGGFERWNDEHRGVRKLVLRLREQPGVYADSARHRRRGTALKMIRRALDTNGTAASKRMSVRAARVVLFGQSLGRAAAIHVRAQP